MKKYINHATVYAILALIGGVFYREFTKFNGFTGDTTLSVVHVHYLVLGMIFFILLLLIDKAFGFKGNKTGKILTAYECGLNLTVIMFLVRGIVQVLESPVSKGMNAAISGIAGIGHIILGVSLVLVLLEIKKSIADK